MFKSKVLLLALVNLSAILASDKWFIHYYQNASKKYSDEDALRIASEASTFENPDGTKLFNHITSYTLKDLDPEFQKKNQKALRIKKGAGLYIWKPKIVQMTLSKMNLGDILLYADTGCELREEMPSLLKLADDQDIVLFHSEHPERKHTKKAVFKALEALEEEKYFDSLQRTGTYFLIKKTKKSVEFVEKWLELATTYELISEGPSRGGDHPGFVSHKHDQSILSVLSKVHGYQSQAEGPIEQSTTIAATKRFTGDGKKEKKPRETPIEKKKKM